LANRFGWLLRLAVIVVVTYVLVCVGMMFLEDQLIFFPSKYPEGNWNPPGLAFEDAAFQAADGVNLHGWFVPHPQPRATVLFAHGNAGHLADRAELLRLLHRLRVETLAFDYRGYGKSAGTPNEAGILADARAARSWLARRTGTSEKDIVLYGESLGGGVAVDLAAADGAGGLILQNAFTSLPDVAAHHYPWLPVRMLMRNRLDALSKIGRYQGPLLQCHADTDEIVPFELGQRLFEAAGSKEKTLIVNRGAMHNDWLSREFIAALDDFFDRCGKR
jgi:hypothetical protein